MKTRWKVTYDVMFDRVGFCLAWGKDFFWPKLLGMYTVVFNDTSSTFFIIFTLWSANFYYIWTPSIFELPQMHYIETKLQSNCEFCETYFSYNFPFDLLLLIVSYFLWILLLIPKVCFFRTLHIMWWSEKQLNHIIIFTTLIYDINFLKPDPVNRLTWTWNFHHTTLLSFFREYNFILYRWVISVFFHVNVKWTLYSLPCPNTEITMLVFFLKL